MRRDSLLALLLAIGLLAAVDCRAADRDPASAKAAPAAEKTASKSVELVVDYGDGVQIRFTALPWREKMTALDAVTAASAHRHGVKFIWRGMGTTAFVTQIGDQKNEGGGAKSQNWLFSINDKESEVGIGDSVLQAGDVILWRFGLLDNNNN